MANRSVVLYVSHIISDVYIERYWCLRELLPTELYDVVWIITRNNLDDYDFLSSHIEKYGEGNREWPWWHRDNNCRYALEECVKGLNPICRYSNRALALLDSYMKEGHSAHSEVMITTCLHNHDMRIADIGGTGEFTPEGYRNRYYIKGVGINNGTMRWRPPFTMEEIEEIEALGTKDRLFHPIK